MYHAWCTIEEMFSCAFRKKNVTLLGSPPVYSEFFISNKLFFLENSINGIEQGVKYLRTAIRSQGATFLPLRSIHFK